MKQHHYTNISLTGLMLFLFLSFNLPAQVSIPWWKHWDKYSDPVGGGVSDPVVIYEEETYKMWFCAWGSNHIYYAESEDGLYWPDPVSVIPGGELWEWDHNKGTGTVLRINDTLRMWYFGYQWSSFNGAYGYAWSLDGIAWNLHGAPVLEKGFGCWDQWGLAPSPRVYYDGYNYHMWYPALIDTVPPSRLAIGHAISPDGIMWVKDLEHSPVIIPGPEGSFYDTRVQPGKVVEYMDTLHMIFTGFNGDGYVPICHHGNLGYAYSPDGINWTVSSDTAMAVGDPGSWDDINVFSPSILFHEGYFKMWYTGAGAGIGIGYAEEPVHCFPDGVTFTCQAEIDNFQTVNPDCRVIKGDVIISGADITDLEGINVLTYINGSLKIENNNLLTSLSGLDNIDPASIEELWITNNPNLSYCAVKSICDYLVAPVGSITIFNNAPDCNNPEEITEACNIITSNGELRSISKFNVAPNPFSGVVNLKYTISNWGSITIDLYQASGIRHQQVLNEIKAPGSYDLEVDLSELPPGIYLFRISTGEELTVIKAVKL